MTKNPVIDFMVRFVLKSFCVFFFYVVGDKMTEIFETLPVKRMYFVFFFLNPYLKSKKNISDNYDNKYGVNINIYFMYI